MQYYRFIEVCTFKYVFKQFRGSLSGTYIYCLNFKLKKTISNSKWNQMESNGIEIIVNLNMWYKYEKLTVTSF